MGFLIPVMGYSQANLEIWPVTLTSSSNKTPVLWIKNLSTKSSSLQIRVLNWKQKKNEDIYSEQNAVYPQPSFLVIGPAEQIPVRFFGIEEKGEKELSYKVVISELPVYSGVEKHKKNSISILMQYVIPFFVYQNNVSNLILPGSDGIPKEKHQIDISKIDGELYLKNMGVTHIKVDKLTLCNLKQNCQSKKMPVTYILPGSDRKLTQVNNKFESGYLKISSGNYKESFSY
ncbi:hypothetical protein PRCB_02495 [Pantoea rodasii]|uniref:Pili assembly chaperone N-terminal domain-containing protein n=2 Tax=Pantoea rodasii TaxID=1076549 RepID=A0A2M9WHV8_9GAMM|nr:hypothetical protein PRCB_02495 [Pantoea rodasii]